MFRPLLIEDAEIWKTFLNDDRATAYFPDFMKGNNPLRALHWVEKQICRYRDLKGGLLAIIDKETGRFVGQSGLIVQDVGGTEEVEIGYHLLPEYWGKGFATEAAMFFKDLAFSSFQIKHLVSNIDVRNMPSQKVAERNGMERAEQIQWKELDIFVYRTSSRNK